jgi:CSLREA domain-containing protein
VLFVAATLLTAASPRAAYAETINVGTTADTIAADGACSLREAVIAANTDTPKQECPKGNGADTIEVPAGTYTRTVAGNDEDAAATGDLDLLANVTIHGAGAASTKIDAAGKDRVLEVAAGVTARLEGLTITGGSAPAGHPGMSTNQFGAPGGPGEDGGGILNSGALTVVATTVTGNLAGDGGSGGNGDHHLAADNGAAGGGSAATGGAGGGIFSSGTLTLTAVTLTANHAGRGGDGGFGIGGGAADGTGGSGGGGNGASGGRGGGLASTGSDAVSVTDSTIAGNHAGDGGTSGAGTGGRGALGGGPSGDGGGDGGAGNGGVGGNGGEGGGLWLGGPLTVTRSTLSGNSAGTAGTGGIGTGGLGGQGAGLSGALAPGGTGGAGLGGPGGSGGRGGGLVAGSVTATNVTIVGNHAGAAAPGGAGTGGTGGVGGTGSGSGVGGPGGKGGNGTGAPAGNGGDGGGLDLATLSLTHGTLFTNSPGGGAPGGVGTAGGGGAGGLGGQGNPKGVNGPAGAKGTKTDGSAGPPGAGGGVKASGSSTVTSSILAGNPPSNCTGSFADGGYNIDFPDSVCPGLAADPAFGIFGPNGGPTDTQSILPGSPAIDLVPAGAACQPTDQRGVPRPVGGACDAGAYELFPPTAATGPAQDLSPTGATLTGTVTPDLRATAYHFEFGTSPGYGLGTADQQVEGGASATPVAAGIGGLTPATTYHYRLVAISPDGTSAGADTTFTTPPPAVVPDTVAPVLSGVGLTRTKFAVGSAATAVSARAKRGTAFRYTLSEAATVRIAMSRASAGRRKGKRCVKPTRKLRRAKKCTRYVIAGKTLTRISKAGANKVAFSGRIGKKRLKPGHYRAVLIATDAAGNRSLAKTLKFRIVRR